MLQSVRHIWRPTIGQGPHCGTTMAKSESTVKKTASAASKVLTSKTASKSEKAVAASALAQTKSTRILSKDVASKAAKILRDPRASAEAKTAAASALTQWPQKKPKDAAQIRAAVARAVQKLG